ncbi:MAG TPA: HAD-IIIA family hydrolase [Oligoflexia bacterium]|nr:HAD-IIIA family hydrolase [Oligoflexia bacterium]
MQPVVFLDRDGTINIDSNYVFKPEQVSLVTGAAQAISRLKKAGFMVAVVSNQSAVGRGMATVEDVDAVNQQLSRLLADAVPGAVIDEFAYCPHEPEALCDCRKPKTGMLNQLTKLESFDPQCCWLVGDKFIDLEFGANIGIPPRQRILVATGHGAGEFAQYGGGAGTGVRYCEDIAAAVNIILEESGAAE